MITATEWLTSPNIARRATEQDCVEWIKQIQADALRHAADIAESYDNESHHGNDTMTKQNIASEIRAAAMPNASS
jgi:hypothetical protein